MMEREIILDAQLRLHRPTGYRSEDKGEDNEQSFHGEMFEPQYVLPNSAHRKRLAGVKRRGYRPNPERDKGLPLQIQPDDTMPEVQHRRA